MYLNIDTWVGSVMARGVYGGWGGLKVHILGKLTWDYVDGTVTGDRLCTLLSSSLISFSKTEKLFKQPVKTMFAIDYEQIAL